MQSPRYVSFRGREDKLTQLAMVFSDYLKGDVLDVGCDTRHLARLVQGRYIGLDIAGWPDIRMDVESGLPFQDRSFDTVIAFDILEHLDRLHSAFDELCRVGRSYIILGLSNMGEWHFRLRFLVGQKPSGKYGLPCEPPDDRHRWLFCLNDAKRFVRQRGAKNGFTVCGEVLGFYAYRRFLPRMATTLGKLLFPYGALIFTYHYWAVPRRDNEYFQGI